MRTDQASTGVAHAVFAGARVDVVAVGGFDAAIEHGACDVVLDISRATEVEGEAVVLLAWLAQKLENAGGRLSVTARRENRGVRVTRTLWVGDLTRVLGVHPALDRAVLHQLTDGAGGAAPS